MTKLDTILKSRDIILLITLYILKAKVFPVSCMDVRVGTWRRALKNWGFQIVVQKTLESALDSQEIKPVNPKGNQPWIFIGTTETPILWSPDVKSWLIGKDPDPGKDGRQEEKGTKRMRWLDSIIDSKGMSLSILREIMKDREAWHAAVHRVAKSLTRLSVWTITTKTSSTSFPGAQTCLTLHPEFPSGHVEGQTCSSTGTNLCRGRWQMPLLFSHSRIFSSTTIWRHQFFGAQLSLWPNNLYMTTGKTIALTIRTFVGKVTSLLSFQGASIF